VDGYTNMQGLDSGRQAVSDKFQVPTYPLTKDDVYLCAGGSMAIWAVMMLLGQEGDNFLFPSPGFPLAPTIAKSMKLEPKIYELQADSKW
jgi:aspartate/methionine/tyrosine aminotransferase